MTNVVEFPAGGALKRRVAEEVRVLMTRRRVKQADLGAVLHVSQAQISQRLNGHIEFTVSEIEALARYFRVSPAALLGYAAGTPHDPDGGDLLPRLDSNQQPFGYTLDRAS